MIELVLSACLLDDPQRCKEVHLAFAGDDVTPMQCLMMSPLEIAKWSEGHPKWVAKRWTCRPAGRFAEL
jgi:hypothetical protein